jgi:tetratricopeptide (TPR) repeat protein
LLSPQEQRLVRAVSVFGGGCELEAAAAVADMGSPEVLVRLASLVDKSLLYCEAGLGGGTPRYRMLETIREFMLERVAANDEQMRLRKQHAAYFVSLAEQAFTHLFHQQAGEWLERLEAENVNIQLALQWYADTRKGQDLARLAGALRAYWMGSGRFLEMRSWTERAIGLAADGPDNLRAELFRWAGMAAAAVGDFASSERYLRETVVLCRRANEPVALALALAILSMPLAAQGQYEEAEAVAREACNLAECLLAEACKDDHPLTIVDAQRTARLTLGDIARARGCGREAVAQYRAAVAVTRQHWLPPLLAEPLAKLGAVTQVLGDRERGAGAIQEALTLARQIGARGILADVLIEAAASARAFEQHDRADMFAREGLELAWVSGRKDIVADYFQLLAGGAVQRMEPRRAAWLIGVADALRKQSGVRLPTTFHSTTKLSGARRSRQCGSPRSRLPQPKAVAYPWSERSRMRWSSPPLPNAGRTSSCVCSAAQLQPQTAARAGGLSS